MASLGWQWSLALLLSLLTCLIWARDAGAQGVQRELHELPAVTLKPDYGAGVLRDESPHSVPPDKHSPTSQRHSMFSRQLASSPAVTAVRASSSPLLGQAYIRPALSEHNGEPGRQLMTSTDNFTANTTSTPVGPKFWWNVPDYNFADAGALCASYSGTLAVLDTSSQLNKEQLSTSVTYWIGLFNSAGQGGRNGTWTWVDQTVYQANRTNWADNEPAPDKTCVLAKWSSGQWRLYAEDCTAQHALACELPVNGSTYTRQPYSCLQQYSLNFGTPLTTISTASLGSDLSQYGQLCADACTNAALCAAFALSVRGGCVLSKRATSQSDAVPVYRPSNTVSCYRYGLDFVAMGSVTAASVLGANWTTTAKCVQDYMVNMNVLEVIDQDTSSCTAVHCANACVARSDCTGFVYSSARCRCQLGNNALYGSGTQMGAFRGSGYLTCLLQDQDWLLFGAVADPSTVSVTLGNQVFTLHPELLSYDAAATVCRTQAPAGGTLASLSSVSEYLLVSSRLLLSQAPRFMTPLPGVEPGLYGVWIGMNVNGTRLLQWLGNDTNVPDGGMVWDDTSAMNRTLLRDAPLWGTSMAGALTGLPTNSRSKVCVAMSNQTELLRPGLQAAASCTWQLPFVCKAPLIPFSNATPTAPIENPNAPTFVVSYEALSDVPPVEPTAELLPGIPAIVTSPGTGLMLWVQPTLEARVSQDDASFLCQNWQSSLVTLPSAGVQAALTAAMTYDTSPYWINLVSNLSLSQWQWGQPNTQANSSLLLKQFSPWCGGAEPDPEGFATCSQLTYNSLQCGGWGWNASMCDAHSSYACQVTPAGSLRHYFCAEAYDLGGTPLVANGTYNFPGLSLQESATWCSDFCSQNPFCHAFTLSDTTCTLKSRDTISLAGDVVTMNATLGCFKYGLLWDTLGGAVAVAAGVASDATTRFRCIRYQDVLRTNLQTVSIKSCRVSDCTAQCYSMRLCSVAVYTHSTCMCTLAWKPLDGGLDGSGGFLDGITTCFFGNPVAFQALGLARGAAYIIPLPADTPPADSGGDIGAPSFPSPPSPSNPSSPSPSPSPPPAPTPTPSNPSNNTAPLPGNDPRPSPFLPASQPPKYTPPPSPTTLPHPSPDSSTSPPEGTNPARPPPPMPAPDGNGNTSNSLFPPPIRISSDGSPGFGISQMIGITVGFCGGVVLLLMAVCFLVVRRRRRNAKQADTLQWSTFTQADALAAGLSPDLARVVVVYLSKGDTIMEGDVVEGKAPQLVLPPALSLEVEHLVAASAPGGSGLSRSAASLLSRLLGGGSVLLEGGGPSPAQLLQTLSLHQGQGDGMIKSAEGEAKVQAGSSVGGSSSPLDAMVARNSHTSGTTSSSVTHLSSELGQGAGEVHFEGHGTKPSAQVLALQQQAQQRPQGDPGALVQPSGMMSSKNGVLSTYIALHKLLGAGSFGTVYAGTWRGQTVAIKIIPHSPSAADRVANEVRLSMQFDHPNVVRSFFFETFAAQAMSHVAQQEAKTAQRESQETWIVLEYCDGGSLASRLYAQPADALQGEGAEEMQGPQPLHDRDALIASMGRVLQIAQDVARGMAYMHSLNICHGDLKCENVLLTKNQEVMGEEPTNTAVAKVGDFGLSRAMGTDGSHLSTATVGTVTHMPPELLLSGRLRASCDVYSFGIMLWQLFTGAVPYSGMRYAEIVYKVAVCALRPTFPADTPTSFRELAEACWQSDAQARPTFAQVVEQLEQLLGHVAALEAEHHERSSPLSAAALPPAMSDDITMQSPWIAACPVMSAGAGDAMAPHDPSADTPAWWTQLQVLPSAGGSRVVPAWPAAQGSPLQPALASGQYPSPGRPPLQFAAASPPAWQSPRQAAHSVSASGHISSPPAAWGTQGQQFTPITNRLSLNVSPRLIPGGSGQLPLFLPSPGRTLSHPSPPPQAKLHSSFGSGGFLWSAQRQGSSAEGYASAPDVFVDVNSPLHPRESETGCLTRRRSSGTGQRKSEEA